jgi:hypothetical protein
MNTVFQPLRAFLKSPVFWGAMLLGWSCLVWPSPFGFQRFVSVRNRRHVRLSQPDAPLPLTGADACANVRILGGWTGVGPLSTISRTKKFAPAWRRRDAANTSAFPPCARFCQEILRMRRRADASGAPADVNGAWESRCL